MRALPCLALLLGVPAHAGAAEEVPAPAEVLPEAEPGEPGEGGADDVPDDGFDVPGDDLEVPDDTFDVPGGDTSVGKASAAPSPWSVSGFARSDWALWAERLGDEPLAQGRQSLDLAVRWKDGPLRAVLSGHGELDVAYLAMDDVDGPTRDTYEWLLDLRESFVAASFGDFELTVGRQIVPWGEGDVTSVLDVVNPRDLREPGLADLDDIRLPVLATRVGWFSGPHRVEAMVVHEASFGYRSPPLGPFSPLPGIIEAESGLDVTRALAGKTVRYEDEQPRFALEDQQLFLRWLYRGEGLDQGLYAANVLDQQGVIGLPAIADLFGSDTVEVRLDHRRYQMLGYSGAMPEGDFLLKWELGLDLGRPLTAQRRGEALVPELVATESTLVNGLVGVTWAGLTDTQIAVEVAKSVRLGELDGDLTFLVPPDAPVAALRVTHQALRQRLQLGLAATALGLTAEHGWLARAEGSYTVADGLKATLGFITYQPGDETGPFTGLDRHDRVFARLRWDFVAL